MHSLASCSCAIRRHFPPKDRQRTSHHPGVEDPTLRYRKYLRNGASEAALMTEEHSPKSMKSLFMSITYDCTNLTGRPRTEGKF